MNHGRDVSEVFPANAVQPVLLAIEFDIPEAVYPLLELGAEVNNRRLRRS